MPYELAHDSIAQQVFQKASTEARTRRKVERYVQDRYQAYTERGAKLTQDDLDFISPYLQLVNISAAEQQFIDDAKKGLARSRRRKRIITASVIAGLSLLALTALLQWRSAEAGKEIIEVNNQRLTQNNLELEQQRKTLESQEKSLNTALQQATDNQATALLRQQEAENARARAEKFSAFAKEQEKEARAALTKAEIAQQGADAATLDAKKALVLADENAQRAKDNEQMAIDNASRAEAAALEAKLLADASYLCALALDQQAEERTFALQSAYEAACLTHFADPLPRSTFSRLANENNISHYSARFQDEGVDAQNNSLALSPDGATVAIGRADGQVLLLRKANLSLLHRLDQLGHHKTVRSLAFSHDGLQLLSGADDGKVCRWDATTGQLLQSYSFDGAVKAVAFAMDDQAIFAAGEGGAAWKKSLAGSDLPCAVKQRATIWDLVFSPDGQYIATASIDGQLKLWDAAGQMELASRQERGAAFRRIAFSGNGQQLAVSDLEGEPILYRTVGLRKIRKLNSGQSIAAEASVVAFSPDGQWLAYAGKGDKLAAVDLQGIQSPVAMIGHEGNVFDLQFTADGQQLLTTGIDGTTRSWNWRYRQSMQTLNENNSGTHDITCDPSGQWIATAGYDRRARLWHNDGNGRPAHWTSEPHLS